MKQAGANRTTLGQDGKPRVAGVLSSFPAGFEGSIVKSACHLVELRVDQMPCETAWVVEGKKIETAGTPVIFTLRLKKEGGGWEKADQERLPVYQDALRHFSVVDVELQSPIAEAVAGYARSHGKTCIISYHDFEKTPAPSDIEALITKAHSLGGIAKIATMANSREDVKVLESILARPREKPLCLIAMGNFAASSRVSFLRQGSCLGYGYLDRPSAPGQQSAAELVAALSTS